MYAHKGKNVVIKEIFKPAGSSSLDSKKRITLGNKIMKKIPLQFMSGYMISCNTLLQNKM